MIVVDNPEASESVYCGVIVQRDTETFDVIAPDGAVVESHQDRPSVDTAKDALAEAGYDTNTHIPFRDLTIRSETLPGDL